jgi:tRNA(fMet)-specific endonuclease VapC
MRSRCTNGATRAFSRGIERRAMHQRSPSSHKIEALRGRHEWLLKAEDGTQLLRAQQGLMHTLRHLALFSIVMFDESAAEEFDHLRQNKKLKKVGRADLLIAAIALANRATLVTRNQKDFRQVPGLPIENWAD